MKTTIQQIHAKFLECSGISTDTRSLQDNEMFFCLKGKNFNGNQFAKQVIEQGAKYVIVDDELFFDAENEKYIFVDDVLQTLQQLARFHRTWCKTTIIALTGSNGKTTTKELIHQVLKQKYEVIATFGNLNNHIGVPLTLLRLTPNTEIGIIEMGANHLNEIKELCEIAQPNFGYITNFGKAHLEGFGGVQGVIQGKSELYDYLKTHNGKAFICTDDDIQIEKSKGLDCISFCLTSNASAKYEYQIQENDVNIGIQFSNHLITSQLTGYYNSINIAAATTIGQYFDIEISKIATAIATYSPKNNRSQWVLLDNNEVLLDAYNANPSSMKLAIENFAKLNKPNKFMILGDMFELGTFSDIEHQKIIELVEKSDIPTIFIGEYFSKNKKSHSKISYYLSVKDYLAHHNFSELHNQTILIKGSRGMALEQIIQNK